MIKEKPVSYKIQTDGTFSIENYTAAKPFANFLPGVAGPFGVPLWVFWVNRGQGVASFGVANKDRSIMEFIPANRAYVEVPQKGFRTFLKVFRKREGEFYEPFQDHLWSQRYDTARWLHVRPWEFLIEEKNMSLGLEVTVRYFTVPNESFPALARKLTVKNTQAAEMPLEILDGLPMVVPCGAKDFFLKNMSRTLEAWMQVERPKGAEDIVFYRLRSDSFDTALYRAVEDAHFYTAFTEETKGRVVRPDYRVDPESVFGAGFDLAVPRVFLQNTPYRGARDEMTEGRTPCAMSAFSRVLKPGESASFYSYFGYAKDPAAVRRRLLQSASAAAFETKRKENERLVRELAAGATTLSASKEFDLYAAQTFLDNALRGGYPRIVPGGRGAVVHLYGRKHGDLERDYNHFDLDPTYFSQGTGHFRDISQNRRCQVWFEPGIGDTDVRTFFNLIQPDGFNPLVVKPVKLKLRTNRKVRDTLKRFLGAPALERFTAFLETPRTPGEVAGFIEETQPSLNGKREDCLDVVLAAADRAENAEHGSGFWTDHWFYCLDLLENYLGVFPEELENILLRKKDFTFYDTPYYVKPRAEKYVRLSGGIRQLDAVGFSEEKDRLIRSRKDEPDKVRTRLGKGKIYRCPLITKIAAIIANKFASLDPQGAGMEMDADRPDWLDSLNGLPALLGSSLSGTFELRRLIAFVEEAFSRMRLPRGATVPLPAELWQFFQKLERAARRAGSSKKPSREFVFWDDTHDAKEAYREATRFGFRGAERRIPAKRFRETLKIFGAKLDDGLGRAWDPSKEICPTYYINEMSGYRAVARTARSNGRLARREVITPVKFTQRRLPPFLEGSVHALRVGTDSTRARKIYGAVRSSELFDRRLGMYRVSASLETESPEIGRIRDFTPGWLENQSIFLHMEYKFLLELLKRNLPDLFFSDLRTALVAFQDPAVYGRSVFENSSFIVSSAHASKKLHGAGFVARLSGSASEFLEMWLLMNIGPRPFFTDDNGQLALRINPSLPPWLFTAQDSQREIFWPGGLKTSVFLPKNSYQFLFLGRTLITYHNPKQLATYGSKRAAPRRIMFQNPKGENVMISSDVLPAPFAAWLREGRIGRLEVELG